MTQKILVVDEPSSKNALKKTSTKNEEFEILITQDSGGALWVFKRTVFGIIAALVFSLNANIAYASEFYFTLFGIPQSTSELHNVCDKIKRFEYDRSDLSLYKKTVSELGNFIDTKAADELIWEEWSILSEDQHGGCELVDDKFIRISTFSSDTQSAYLVPLFIKMFSPLFRGKVYLHASGEYGSNLIVKYDHDYRFICDEYMGEGTNVAMCRKILSFEKWQDAYQYVLKSKVANTKKVDVDSYY